ncbi:MAG: DUF1802 family protein [Candidatus Palauibacterales bacterium]|nr:DUF1802 family protein [Candidatus Palauibacterales bacterium]
MVNLRADDAAVALREWAVTCDALARGEQILLLRADPLETDGAGPASLPREAFWLYPTLEGQSASRVADPYRDRMRALDDLDRDDGRVRLQYAATAEHVERIADRDRLMALDGHHTLNRSAVERLLEVGEPGGVLFMVLRTYRRPTAVVVEETPEMREADGWVRVPDEQGAAVDRSRVEEEMSAVLSDERFLERKAELLQLSGSMQAM